MAPAFSKFETAAAVACGALGACTFCFLLLGRLGSFKTDHQLHRDTGSPGLGHVVLDLEERCFRFSYPNPPDFFGQIPH